MSRRKQKFPFHIAGEGDSSNNYQTETTVAITQGQKETHQTAENSSSSSSNITLSDSGTTLSNGLPQPLAFLEKPNCNSNSNITLSDSGTALSNGLPQPLTFLEKPNCNSFSLMNNSLNQMNCSSATDCDNDETVGENEQESNIEIVKPSSSEKETTPNEYFTTHTMGDIQPVYTIAKDSTVEANHSAKNSILVPLTVAFIQSSNSVCPINGSILLQRSEDLYQNQTKIVGISNSVRCTTPTESLQAMDGKIYVQHHEQQHQQQLQQLQQKSSDKDNAKNSKQDFPSFICPVCQESFKSKRSFNSHILVHCQLVKSPPSSTKRSTSEATSSSSKRPVEEVLYSSSVDKPDICETSMPLDLSCKNVETCNLDDSNLYIVSESYDNNNRPLSINKSISSDSHVEMYSPGESLSEQRQTPDQFHSFDLQNHSHSVLSDRSPTEDENENLVNEALEHEKAFFDNNSQNEHFLSEDSTGFDLPAPLPLVNSGGVTRKIKVCSDDGPPMVYKIKFYSEQIFVSRILGINEETGDKIELYKCYLCNLSFPSVSRLQAHLLIHKQRFVCRKCNISCDSRIQFSQHVQKEHVSRDSSGESNRLQIDISSDTSNAENTVTVAALLSALHGNSIERKSIPSEEENEKKTSSSQEDEEGGKSEESLPSSPSSETPMEIASESMEATIQGNAGKAGGTEGDMFKMFSCRYCGKKFDRAFSCNRHERVHTGYKPCFCRICGRGFSEPRNLRHHVIRFHSDGSLRHLIKRDRRKRKDDEPNSETLSHSEYTTKGILKECGNKEITNGVFSNYVVNRHESAAGVCVNNNIVSYSTVHNGVVVNSFPSEENGTSESSTLNTYTSNLTKIFAASLDNSPRNRISEISPNLPEFKNTTSICTTEAKLQEIKEPTVSDKNDTVEPLEPGEIRLNKRAKVVSDGEAGRRLILAEDSDDGSDHSPQFSSYAPRLNIVQEPVKRDTLVPITDDIGRTFYECPYCFKFFGSTSDLNRHLDFHEDLRPYDCEYCEYSARTNSQLKVHKMRHEGIKQFTCDVCNYNGVTQSDLNRHKKTQSHIARSQNICSMCGLGFYSPSQKQIHIAKCHPEMEGASSLLQMSLGIPPSSSTNASMNVFISSTEIPASLNVSYSSPHFSNELSCSQHEIDDSNGSCNEVENDKNLTQLSSRSDSVVNNSNTLSSPNEDVDMGKTSGNFSNKQPLNVET